MKAMFAALMLMMSTLGFAQSEIYTGYFSSKAVGGYDTVAYFTQGKPVKGSSDYKTEFKGANWYFASQANLDLFKQDPDKYAPQYGGYCAWAVSAKNDFAKGDPEHWSIVDGKLYLNYNQNIKDKWSQDIPGHIAQGDKNWPTLIAK
ncbi:YHS domain-containing (seleno)protein [Marinomonas mediterranea]|jgi:YHS domain.|uniref:YHS domain-containing protein n=1 Tax=Marinomonas mediterranea (strain ATCC 700492 / JCM 21426 / NBRC 103028 / MMB-1) TaxID=717774 RepID=F2JYS5_MARM1|nr:YHS domain-containing (seleno)protein [Marinomonas mediterranea]ADZ89700.1 YHS domain-containing protein [Marinomonas mediterranea MMB-1]WCN07789.1 YHS domain-containing protein [Marinomonas mediterranea]WCN11886.1 YHS domain-containing protein [Marinomonas mediterranea]WCN15931.1 YHS domain-containing protein [Marinomonas mediterranea MMB-1]